MTSGSAGFSVPARISASHSCTNSPTSFPDGSSRIKAHSQLRLSFGIQLIRCRLFRSSSLVSTKSVSVLWISVWSDHVHPVIGRFQPLCSFIRQIFTNLFVCLDSLGNETSLPTTCRVVSANSMIYKRVVDVSANRRMPVFKREGFPR